MALRDFASTRLGTVVVLAVTTGLILGGLWFVRGRGDDSFSQVTLTGDTSGAAPVVGQKAATFATTDMDGEAVDLADLLGQPVWLIFGATWCPTCRAESADIEAVHQTLGDKAQILAIYVDNDSETVRDYADRLGLTFRQVPDPNTSLGSLYRIMGVPMHFFIAPDGTIDQIKIGALSKQAALDTLTALIDQR
ncbi:MAG: TlpA family protein disulfide reductase [Micrococcales bacterium]|nr:TlpA family protein disulfide reductase [Micrococcales bacterium]